MTKPSTFTEAVVKRFIAMGENEQIEFTDIPIRFLGRGIMKGFSFTQVDKGPKSYMYEVNTGSSIHYEVFRRKENKMFGVVSYPKANSFGVWAWTYPTLEAAKKRFNSL